MAEPLTYALISYALGLAAQRLYGAKNKAFARDDKPTTVATRGSFIPIRIGRFRKGPLFGWAGDRVIKEESPGGGSGLPSAPDIQVYYERGWHHYGIGPAFRLHKLFQHGKPIWSGPIDAISHPSGSTVSMGKEGSFRVYWGESGQPINTELGDPSRVGVASQWPFFFYLYMVEKRLGAQAVWPLIDAEFEIRPFQTALSMSTPWIEATRVLSGTTYSIVAVTNGPVGTCSFEISGNHANEYPNGTVLRISGNSGLPNGDYPVLDATYVHHTGVPPTIVIVNRTVIRLGEPISGATVSGTIAAYVLNLDDGANPAHIIYQLLFQTWPHGIGLDPSDFDLNTLEQIGIVCATERLAFHCSMEDGISAQSVLASMMQDIGFLMPPMQGKYRFQEIRPVNPLTAPVLTADVASGSVLENKVPLGEKPVDRVTYTFTDRARGYRDNTVPVNDEGHSSYYGRVKPKKIEIANANDLTTASKIAERRMMEDLPGGSSFKIQAGRESRLLLPGRAVQVSGFAELMRVDRIKPKKDSSVNDIELVLDSYGAAASSYVATGGGGALPPTYDPQADFMFNVLEVPAHTANGKVRIVVPRIRATAQIAGADIWISRDNITYQHKLRTFKVQTGGLLQTAMLATDPTLVELGPTVLELGPDILTVPDLSLDVVNWRAGRVIMAIDDELMYPRNLVPLGAGTYRVDGILRARLATVKAAHPIGSAVFIFQIDQIEHIEDVLLGPGEDLYVKTQPFTTESYPLGLVTPVQVSLVGKGIVPMNTENLRTTNNSNSYRTGEAIPVKWAYRSAAVPKTGAGMQGAGNPVGSSPVQGSFVVRFLTSGNVIKREIGGLLVPNYSYPNAMLISDFGSEPSSLKVQVEDVDAGYRSTTREITVVKV